MSKVLELTLSVVDPDTFEEKDFEFTVDNEKYSNFRTAIMGKDKVTPIHNFVAVCCDKEQRSELVAILRAEQGLADKIAEPLLENWDTKVEVIVKKRKPTLSTSPTTP